MLCKLSNNCFCGIILTVGKFWNTFYLKIVLAIIKDIGNYIAPNFLWWNTLKVSGKFNLRVFVSVVHKVAANGGLLAAGSGIGSTAFDLCSKAKQNVLQLHSSSSAAIVASNC